MGELPKLPAVFGPRPGLPDLRDLSRLEILQHDGVVPFAVDLVLPRVALVCAFELASIVFRPARLAHCDLHLVLFLLATVQLCALAGQRAFMRDEHLAHDNVVDEGIRAFNRIELVVPVQLDVRPADWVDLEAVAPERRFDVRVQPVIIVLVSIGDVTGADRRVVAYLLRDVVKIGPAHLEGLTEDRIERLLESALGACVLGDVERHHIHHAQGPLLSLVRLDE